MYVSEIVLKVGDHLLQRGVDAVVIVEYEFVGDVVGTGFEVVRVFVLELV